MTWRAEVRSKCELAGRNSLLFHSLVSKSGAAAVEFRVGVNPCLSWPASGHHGEVTCCPV